LQKIQKFVLNSQNIVEASKYFRKLPRNVLAPNELKNIFRASRNVSKYLK
jgi:hypothetical protein